MNSRLYDLLDTFELKSRLIRLAGEIDTIGDIDYARVNEILDCEKAKSVFFLKNALEG